MSNFKFSAGDVTVANDGRVIIHNEEFIAGRMKRETIDSIKTLLQKRASGLEHLRIRWFGGEPLLVKDIILEISSCATSLVKMNPQLNFSSGMSTNGYLLTPDTTKQLVLHGVSTFQVSLDGPASYHDQVRKRRDGKGTFEKIWKNLMDLKNSSLDFKVMLRVHFSKDNVNVIDPLIKDIKENFCNDNRFHLFFKSIVPLGGKNDSSMNYFSDQEAEKVKQGFVENHSPLRLDDANTASYICYAGNPTALVIRQDGSISKCTVGLSDPENQIGVLRANGEIEIDQAKYQAWIKGAVSLDEEVLRCPRAFMNPEEIRT
jgi:uncharacterized protein